ncbi:MAG: hypothetical protein IKR11_05235 [Solobacterium sp.]|nr:hypothetical protein [Solobacterium sp.]
MSRYKTFKYYQRMEKEYANKKREANAFIQRGDKGWPARYYQDLGQTFLDFLHKFEAGDYAWTGEDADACYNKMKALREEQNRNRLAFHHAFDTIIANLEEDRLSYARKAMITLDSFDEWDWAECTVKETPEYLKDLVRKMFS